MTTFHAKALYDFDGEPGTAELSIRVGDRLTVTRTDVGEGWWEGVNAQGKMGLFPEAYVEKESSGPPNIPPPSLPVTEDWNKTESPHYDDTWDDDWDDDTPQELPQRNEQIYANEPNHNQLFGSQTTDGDSVSELGFSTDNRGKI